MSLPFPHKQPHALTVCRLRAWDLSKYLIFQVPTHCPTGDQWTERNPEATSGTETMSSAGSRGWREGRGDLRAWEGYDPRSPAFPACLSVCQLVSLGNQPLSDSLATPAALACWPPGQASLSQSRGLSLYSSPGLQGAFSGSQSQRPVYPQLLGTQQPTG